MGVDPRDVDQLVGIENSEPPIVEFHDSILPQVAQYSVHVNEGQARRVSDVLLGQGQVHLLDPAPRPLRTVADEQLEEQVCNALARRTPPDAGQVVEGQAAVPANQPREPHADLRVDLRQGVQGLVRNHAHHRIRQSLRAKSRCRAAGRMETKHGARQREMQDLPPSILQDIVEEHPAVDEVVDGIAGSAQAETSWPAWNARSPDL